LPCGQDGTAQKMHADHRKKHLIFGKTQIGQLC
jgi:hypothetical protein